MDVKQRHTSPAYHDVTSKEKLKFTSLYLHINCKFIAYLKKNDKIQFRHVGGRTQGAQILIAQQEANRVTFRTSSGCKVLQFC